MEQVTLVGSTPADYVERPSIVMPKPTVLDSVTTTTCPEAGWIDARPSFSLGRSKVALVGFASTTRLLAPFQDPNFEIWGINQLYKHIPTWHRLFDMHSPEHIAAVPGGHERLDFLRKLPGPDDPKYGPVYMPEHYDEIPASVAIEPTALQRRLLGDQDDLQGPYFASGPGYMMAVAIDAGFREIHLYGIDLLDSEEFTYQRPNLEFWIGVAKGRGIKVYVPKQSALLKASYLYGFTWPTPQGQNAHIIKFLKDQRDKIESKIKEQYGYLNMSAGALKAVQTVAARHAQGLNTSSTADQYQELGVWLTTEHGKMRDEYLQMISNHSRGEGNLEALASCITWLEHDARGGALVVE
jgi:hypothetical protein